jgi:two-component system chemotaxis response regulator CheB
MIRVLIAEDSPTCRDLLIEILDAESDLHVIGTAPNGNEAVRMVKSLRPDVVVMDIHMPEIDGFEATRRIMVEAPTPIVIVSSTVNVRETRVSMQALRAGALTVLQKPAPGDNFETGAHHFNSTVRAMAGVRVVRRWSDKPVPTTIAPAISVAAPVRVVAMAASTGGPAAIHRIFSDLPSDFSTPILLVQHIAPGFIEGLATWLRESSGLNIKVATQGQLPQPKGVYLAPDDHHLGVTSDGRITIFTSPAVEGFRPSATVLFRSVAKTYGRSCLAVILTGMGEDGLDGLRDVHATGGRVIAQDEASSVVFGMPGAAVAAGLADEVIPLHQIASRLHQTALSGRKLQEDPA